MAKKINVWVGLSPEEKEKRVKSMLAKRKATIAAKKKNLPVIAGPIRPEGVLSRIVEIPDAGGYETNDIDFLAELIVSVAKAWRKR